MGIIPCKFLKYIAEIFYIFRFMPPHRHLLLYGLSHKQIVLNNQYFVHAILLYQSFIFRYQRHYYVHTVNHSNFIRIYQSANGFLPSDASLLNRIFL